MKHIRVTYTTELVTANKVVHSEGCNCISFLNYGTCEAWVLGDVPLESTGARAQHFNNDVDEIIHQNFPVTFSPATGRSQAVVVIKCFKERY